eukprot:gnl/Chilomastix_caulleri/8312.p2 GENE.gnl/Chilomastix_caulleri/8312~~gnl/Chilomastix_caulleri/8312.p2  ORF type:complete len:83 (-),score=12.56 gnl/Chilomastix_caulleri/8312:133-381(-)
MSSVVLHLASQEDFFNTTPLIHCRVEDYCACTNADRLGEVREIPKGSEPIPIPIPTKIPPASNRAWVPHLHLPPWCHRCVLV